MDDHSRLLVHGRWVGNETLRAGQEVLHAAILRRGLPEQLHVDNGPAFAGHELRRSCAVLGIRLIHSRPYSAGQTSGSDLRGMPLTSPAPSWSVLERRPAK